MKTVFWLNEAFFDVLLPDIERFTKFKKNKTKQKTDHKNI